MSSAAPVVILAPTPLTVIERDVALRGIVTLAITSTLEPDGRWQDWLRRADSALYRAERDGRDRLVVDRVVDRVGD